ncbi:hypothetical protein [Stieleria varia]|uniref:Uncharacterized protein n=1 Tax=Stieleria varia TaxID=2528005 RepID=A0A5C6ANM4_9BACT|nr:hypothetical protein [Stieleria varia]TWU01280.1 hypothetical protein Pla52n_46540 [Stieleria varia]
MIAAKQHGSFCLREVAGIDRFQQPVSVGIPFSDENCTLPTHIIDEAGKHTACQCSVLSKWASGRPRWVLITACVDILSHSASEFWLSDDHPVSASSTHTHELVAKTSASSLPSLLSVDRDAFASIGTELSVVRQNGESMVLQIQHSDQVADGPVYRTLSVTGNLGARRPIRFIIRATHYKPAGLFKVELTLHNPRRAEHQGGFWDLGDPQSEHVESAVLSFSSDFAADRTLHWKEQQDSQWMHSDLKNWSLSQLNSGGQRWQSRVHVDAQGNVLSGSPGYEVTLDGKVTRGTRAAPTVQLQDHRSCLAATMVDFWQKFPSAMEIDGSSIKTHLYPKHACGAMELQPGEQTTRTVWLSIARPDSRPDELDWVHCPLVAVPTETRMRETDGLEWVASIPIGHFGNSSIVGHNVESLASTAGASERVDAKTPRQSIATDADLLEEMLSGDRNFFWKREQIDEYGWRNYGDSWADHEEAYSEDPKPVISHYNNQYDLLQGLLRQYLRTYDPRWWALARPLAEHVMDIDIYHTEKDKAAYNGGLFWHTSHYRDAGLATHRTYSRLMTGDKHHVNGGGPSNEHNYTSGLLLYHHLTGCPRAKEAVLSLANWVIAMDDGCQSVLAPVSSLPTGNASSTSDPGYHGPGRGVGNSINALIDGWQLTREPRYLHKCGELIRRAIHPEDDIAELNLLDAELRWSYTVGLQAAARYEAVVGDTDPELCEYIRASLIRFGRWMQQNESLYLSEPKVLEFPTETWAAQDMRKGVTMMMISRYLPNSERRAMHDAGVEFFASALQQLREFPTRNGTRPSAIALQQFPLADHFQADADQSRKVETTRSDRQWPDRLPLRTQKQDLKSSLRSPLGLLKLAVRGLRPSPWMKTIPETPIGRQWRNWISQ